MLSALKPIAKRFGAHLLVHGRADIARTLELDGVHLTSRCCPPHDARELLGETALIGYSAHSVDEALQVLKPESSCDYVFLSPIFQPTSKKTERSLLALEPLRELCIKTNQMVFALGGITSANAAACLEAGASGIAVIGEVFGATDPVVAANKLTRAIKF